MVKEREPHPTKRGYIKPTPFDTPLTGESFGLLPCPFCKAHLVEVKSFSNRTAIHLTHARTMCVLDGINVIVSERYDDENRLILWNTREGVEHSTHKGPVRKFFNPGVHIL